MTRRGTAAAALCVFDAATFAGYATWGGWWLLPFLVAVCLSGAAAVALDRRVAR